MNTVDTTKSIGTFALVMLMTGAIDSIRNLPTAALFGSHLIFFFILAAFLFLIPVALVSAELAASWPKHGGIYQWVRLAFGEKVGFFAIWLQWVNTMVWYPTMLSFIAATAVYFIDPSLAHNRLYLVSVILGLFWSLTLINLKGLDTSTKFATICTVLGMVIPVAMILILAMVWLISGHGSQLHFSSHDILPQLNHSQSWISLTAIITSFLGLELATVHVKDIKNPQKKFPKAMLWSSLLIVSTMALGSLAIAMIIPGNKIELVDGVTQAFQQFLSAFHMSWLLPILSLMIVLGAVGGMVNWIISPAKGLLQAAESGFLPKVFTKTNKHGVAQNLLLAQALLVTAICLVYMLMPSVNGSYWLLTDLSTQLYVVMYVMMFAAALVLRNKTTGSLFKIPGGKIGLTTVVCMGLLGCLITLFIGFFPPASIDVGSNFKFIAELGGGMILLSLPVLIFFKLGKVPQSI